MLARDLIKKIRKIEIKTSRLVNHQLAGQYHSVFKGRGMAFEEVRQYQPGDDIRLIDWNVSARFNDVFIKLFVEEREMTVMLLVDMSASNAFGSTVQSKREIAAEMAALLAFSAIKNNDRVGLILFTDVIERFVPPKKGKKHVLRVVTEILSFQPQGKHTDLAIALSFLGRVAKRRSVTFLFSDFFPHIPADETPDPQKHAISPEVERALRIVARRHDFVPVSLADPLEENLPAVGVLNLQDLETGQTVLFDAAGPEGKTYRKFMHQVRVHREALFRRLSMDFIHIRTAEPYLTPLLNFFRMRERRR